MYIYIYCGLTDKKNNRQFTENSEFHGFLVLSVSILRDESILSSVFTHRVYDGKVCVIIHVLDLDTLGGSKRYVVSPNPFNFWRRFPYDIYRPFVSTSSLDNYRLEIRSVDSRFN